MRAGDDDPDVRVIVLTGVGRGFSAGVDVRSVEGFDGAGPLPGARVHPDSPDATRQRFLYATTKLIKDISYIRKPTIAMVNGVAAGLGMDMALQCDIRYGCENTRFITYQQVGQIIENGGAYWLPKLAGLGRALEFAFTGFLDAERTYQWGILNKLVPSDQLENEVRALCAQIVKSPPITQWINKRNMRAAIDSNLETTAIPDVQRCLDSVSVERRGRGSPGPHRAPRSGVYWHLDPAPSRRRRAHRRNPPLLGSRAGRGFPGLSSPLSDWRRFCVALHIYC